MICICIYIGFINNKLFHFDKHTLMNIMSKQ